MRRITLISISCAALIGLAFAGGPAWAQKASGSKNKGNQTNSYTLDQDTYKQVQRVEKLMGNNKYAKARNVAKSVLPRAKKESDYAHALVAQLIAQTYLLQKDLDKAEPYLETIVKLDALQPQSQESVIQELATIYLSQKKYDQSIRLYKEVISDREQKKKNIPADIYYHLGLAYSFAGTYPPAMKNIEKAIGMAKKPNKDWYQNWFIVAYKMKNYHKANNIAQTLVAKWPDDQDFWNYYGNTALLLHDDKQATAIYELMHKRGMFKSGDDYMQLANLLIESKAPYKAAEVLSEGLNKGLIKKTADNYDTLASSWMQAREWDKALKALGEEAKLAPTGSVYMRQASIYLNQQDYAKAMQAAQNALNKGGLDHPGRGWMVLGQAAFEQKDWTTAMKAFHKAENYKEQRSDAQNWIKYVTQARSGGS